MIASSPQPLTSVNHGSTDAPHKPINSHIAESNSDPFVTPSSAHTLESTGHSWPSLLEALSSLYVRDRALPFLLLPGWPFFSVCSAGRPSPAWSLHIPIPQHSALGPSKGPHLSLASIGVLTQAQVLSTISRGDEGRDTRLSPEPQTSPGDITTCISDRQLHPTCPEGVSHTGFPILVTDNPILLVAQDEHHSMFLPFLCSLFL